MKQISVLVSAIIRQIFGSQLRQNMTSGVILMLISILTWTVSYPIYLHFLGYEKFGLWLILAVVLGFAQLGLLGTISAITKLVAEEHEQGNLLGVESYIAMSLMTVMTTGSIVLVIILLFKELIISAFKLGGTNADTVHWLLPYVGVLSVYVLMVQVINTVLAGLGRMDLANYTQAVGRVVAVIISVAMLFFGKGIESLLIGNAFSYIAVHIMSFILIRRQAKVRFLRLNSWDWGRLRRLMSFGGGVFGGMLMNLLLDPFNKLMLSRYTGVASVTVYDIAYKTAMQIRGIGEVGFRALVPEISRFNANMNGQANERINTINRKAIRLILIGGLPFFGILFVFAAFILKAWLNKNFVEALTPAFRIMLVAAFVSLLGIPAFYTHMGKGNVRYGFIATIIQSLLNVTIVMAYAVFAPDKIGSHIFYAIALGMLASTVYLDWQIYRDNRNVPS